MLPTGLRFAPIIPRSSYYESDYRQGKALLRARRPYIIKNLVTGVAIIAFTSAVYAYTIRAVSQDDFEDVPVPPGPPSSATQKEGTK
ncbi:hypothetical protein BDZ91DRAFT_721469 [Kalaharituber pfeilii]|nr:hypothetical protein BDZ91DRAFT_721469 [Kalaharituber pfeilii]